MGFIHEISYRPTVCKRIICFLGSAFFNTEEPDTNKMSFSYTNSLFAPISFDIELDGFYNEHLEPLTISTTLSVNEDCTLYDSEILCLEVVDCIWTGTGCIAKEQTFEYDFSNHFIGNPDSEINLETIGYKVTTSIVNNSIIIEMDNQLIIYLQIIVLF